jgi:hypothetical protein
MSRAPLTVNGHRRVADVAPDTPSSGCCATRSD